MKVMISVLCYGVQMGDAGAWSPATSADPGGGGVGAGRGEAATCTPPRCKSREIMVRGETQERRWLHTVDTQDAISEMSPLSS